MAKRDAKKGDAEEPQSFEAALEELEEITERMEAGDVALDESLRLYERGTFLLGFCQKRLDTAEQQIQKLSRGDGGKLTTKPLNDAGEDADE